MKQGRNKEARRKDQEIKGTVSEKIGKAPHSRDIEGKGQEKITSKTQINPTQSEKEYEEN